MSVGSFDLEIGETLQTDHSNGIESFAVFSECMRYRYLLHRKFNDGGGGMINFLMLNPSTADAFKNDPTVGRCQSRALELGYSSFAVTNLFSYRSTDPSHLLWPHIEPIGMPNNPRWILEVARKAKTVVVAWGNHGRLRRDGIIRWDLQVLDNLVMAGINPVCLGQNVGGSPKHPLYLRKDLELRPFVESVF
jgi:hypothetical protein